MTANILLLWIRAHTEHKMKTWVRDFVLSPHTRTKHITGFSRRYKKNENMGSFLSFLFFMLFFSHTYNKIKTQLCICTFLTTKLHQNYYLNGSLPLRNYFWGIYPTHLNVYSFIFKKNSRIHFYCIYLCITQLKENWMQNFKLAVPTSSKENLGAHYEEYQQINESLALIVSSSW